MKKFRLILYSAAVFLLSTCVTAQTIQVLAPNGGENWRQGSIQTITWDSSGIESGTYQLTLWKDGASLGVIANGLPCTQRSFSWTAGNLESGGMAPAGSGYTVKIRLQGEAANDFSNAAFTLVSNAPNIRCESMQAIGWDYTFLPATFGAGDTVTIRYRLVNDSGSPAGSFQVGLRVGGTIVDRKPMAELGAYDETADSFSWTAVCGAAVEVVADCDHEVSESNESDNIMTDPGLVCSDPNLLIWDGHFSASDPNRASAGLNYQFYARIRSDTLASRNVRVIGGVVGGAVLLDRTFATISRGESEHLEFTWEVPEGSSRIYFQVDPDDTVSESDESDNRWELALTGIVIDHSEVPYDLRLTLNKIPRLRAVGSKITLPVGQPITLAGQITGATGAIRDVTINCMVRVKENPPVKVYTTTIREIESRVVPFSFSWTPTKPGETTIAVQVSPGPYASTRGVRDVNPANNTDSIRVTVIKPGNLIRK